MKSYAIQVGLLPPQWKFQNLEFILHGKIAVVRLSLTDISAFILFTLRKFWNFYVYKFFYLIYFFLVGTRRLWYSLDSPSFFLVLLEPIVIPNFNNFYFIFHDLFKWLVNDCVWFQRFIQSCFSLHSQHKLLNIIPFILNLFTLLSCSFLWYNHFFSSMLMC